jgi:hypothetical protein
MQLTNPSSIPSGQKISPQLNQVKTFFAHACAVQKLAAGSAANQTDLATPHQVLLGVQQQ